MKKVAIRKLNRTLLKKEGTKQVYITGIQLLKLFGISRIDELDNEQTENSKMILYLKDDYYESDNPQEIIVYITRANNEVRITGNKLAELVNTLNITEVDNVIIEVLEDKSENTLKLLSFSKEKNIRVFQKIDNTNINEIKESKESYNYESGYWSWDNSDGDDFWAEKLNEEIEVYFYNDAIRKRKTIRVKKIGEFKKKMKALARYQDKNIYLIEEKDTEEWKAAKFSNLKLLEITNSNNRITIVNRNNNIWKYYERESIK